MYLMINNKDSFVYNLVAYFKELGHHIDVYSTDAILHKDLNMNGIKGIIISPGPGKPEQATNVLKILQKYKNSIPIMGVCLGHQIIALAFGGVVCKGIRPMHGKVTELSHNGERLFKNLPGLFSVTRYHSLVVKESTVQKHFFIDSYSEDGVVMAISHKTFPLYGVQFHPEAILTEHGFDILRNFNNICEEWWGIYAHNQTP